ncbi:hypothetical protein EVAR_57442_1 [Eumeta japonica]|uniref:Uncharacterized protein n=1 Tax=Eumeta variegata TaxID=151549 RepID=A0A4C1YD44_EUMVA|nr:hypothetical protein EVAR_57442_1 [Eumeta japonica]
MGDVSLELARQVFGREATVSRLFEKKKIAGCMIRKSECGLRPYALYALYADDPVHHCDIDVKTKVMVFKGIKIMSERNVRVGGEKVEKENI